MHYHYLVSNHSICFEYHKSLTAFQGHLLREVGFHAHFLESGRCTAELLPLYDLPGEPCPFGLPLESLRSRSIIRLLSVHVLDLGYNQ